MTDAVAAALADARANAANAVAAAPAPAPVVAAAVPAVGAPRVRSLADVAATYVERPDLFIKVNENGILIGDEVGYIEELFGTIKLSEVHFPAICRYTVAGSHKYLRTYDGVREVTSGKAWGQAIAEAQQVDPRAETYDSVEFGLVLTQEPKKNAIKAGAQLTEVPVGSRVGYTASKTGFDPVMKFLTGALKTHGEEGEVAVRAFHIPKTKGQNKWGVVGLEAAAN